MSVVKAKAAVSKPGTVRILTGGTSSTVSRATRARKGARHSRTSDPGPTVLKLSSASADGATLFHKNRDNVDCEQAAYVLASSLAGVNKFIAVSNASAVNCSMMVNDKGLAGSADYPAHLTRKGDPHERRVSQCQEEMEQDPWEPVP